MALQKELQQVCLEFSVSQISCFIVQISDIYVQKNMNEENVSHQGCIFKQVLNVFVGYSYVHSRGTQRRSS
jgi:hypothetical protein